MTNIEIYVTSYVISQHVFMFMILLIDIDNSRVQFETFLTFNSHFRNRLILYLIESSITVQNKISKKKIKLKQHKNFCVQCVPVLNIPLLAIACFI